MSGFDTPGQPIWSLAHERRSGSENFLLLFALGTGAVLGTLGVLYKEGVVSLSLSGFYKVIFLIAGYSLYRGLRMLVRARHAEAGARAEEDIGSLLLPLREEGWDVSFNHRIPRYGDVDIVVTDPSGSLVFAIDVKSREGKITDGFLSGDHLTKKCRGQAATLRDTLGVRWVEPVLCFANASWVDPQEANGVAVTRRETLLSYLRKRGASGAR